MSKNLHNEQDMLQILCVAGPQCAAAAHERSRKPSRQLSIKLRRFATKDHPSNSFRQVCMAQILLLVFF